MAFAKPETQTQLAAINITPLVDVLLVLLVIFMVTAPMLSRTLPMQLPGPGPAPVQPTVDLRLQIGMAGDYTLDGRAVARETLVSALRDALALAPGLRLRIAAADDSDYQAFITAIAAARQAGIRNVGAEMR